MAHNKLIFILLKFIVSKGRDFSSVLRLLNVDRYSFTIRITTLDINFHKNRIIKILKILREEGNMGDLHLQKIIFLLWFYRGICIKMLYQFS